MIGIQKTLRLVRICVSFQITCTYVGLVLDNDIKSLLKESRDTHSRKPIGGGAYSRVQSVLLQAETDDIPNEVSIIYNYL